MKIHDIEQRSAEWHEVRTGRITATSFPTMANPKSPASLENLCMKTAAERITGVSSENSYTNASMENGATLEDEARNAYEIERLCHIQEVGFISMDEYIGCSPDGLVDDDGGVEIKCPEAHTHLGYLLAGTKAGRKYHWQIQGALWITGRAWWDFVSYCPAFPEGQRLLIVRVEPDAKAFEKLTAGAKHCRERIAEIVKGYGNGDPNQDV